VKLGRAVLVLAALQGGRATNGELRALFAARTGMRLKQSSLSTITSRLHKAKLIDSLRPGGKHKAHNAYELTPRGREHLWEMRRLLAVRSEVASSKGQAYTVLQKHKRRFEKAAVPRKRR
jgi:DNA-binding PadR family transcriptional regulator